jgi:hypothetical protein
MFWWFDHAQALGLVGGVAMIGLLAFLMFPRGPASAHVGVVTGFRSISSETGTEVYASVDLVSYSTLVLLPSGHDCAVGSAIALHRIRFAIGERYVVQGRGCAVPVRR